MRHRAFAVLDLPGDVPRDDVAIRERMAEATSRVRLGDPGLGVDGVKVDEHGLRLVAHAGLDQPPLYSVLCSTSTLAIVHNGRVTGAVRILLFRVAGCHAYVHHDRDRALDGVHFSEAGLLAYNDLHAGH